MSRKYIRTDEGIFDVGTKQIIDNLEVYFIRKGDKFKWVPVEWVIKESKNIEDLVDEYVIDCSVKDKPFVYTLPKDIKSYYLGLSQEIKEETDVYGSIWTGEGLKYVAKMNKYGDLELI